MARAPKAKPGNPAPRKNNPSELRVSAPAQGKTLEDQAAGLAADGVVGNAAMMKAFSLPTFGELGLTECVSALAENIKATQAGDLAHAEAMLTAQAAALNTIFINLAGRAGLNFGEYLDAAERYMRLALKAQAQSRATLETLAAIKNPPVVFARQANINNGGQQQVNNGGAPATAPDPARAATAQTAPTELLEASDGQWMDSTATSSAGRADPHLAAVGEVHRPENR